MPLAFDSMSHGTVAFGFFNIESDMLLLDELFFFADRFCRAVIDLSHDETVAPSIPGWRIAERSKIGNLHGAIGGIDFSGFIGATYRRFPFPRTPEGFKQNPKGYLTQKEISEMIARWGVAETIQLSSNDVNDSFLVGEYRFTRDGFLALRDYVDRGGYPRWRDGVRPDYVTAMTRLGGSSTR